MTSSPRTLSTGFLVLFVVLLGGLSFWIFWPFLTPIAWALILWRLFDGPHERLAARVNGRRAVSATIMTLGIMVLIVLPLAYTGAVAASEVMHLYEVGKEWIGSGGLTRLPERVAQVPLVGSISQDFLGKMIGAYGPVEPPPEAATIGKSMAGTIGEVAKQIAEGLTNFLITLFTLFFLFRDSPSLYKTFNDVLPLEAKAKREIFECLDQAVVAIVRGTLLTAVAQGLVAGLTYWLLNLPLPLLLGALSAVASLVPVGGTALVWGPLAVYLLVTGAIWKGLTLLAVGIVIVGLMDNLVHPLLIGTEVHLPLILVFFASLGGLAWMGFIGLFVGPIILALTKATFHILLRMYRHPISIRLGLR